MWYSINGEGYGWPLNLTRFEKRNSHPVWLGDSWILFSSNRRRKADDVYMMRCDATGVTRLTDGPEDESPEDIFVAPKGRQ